MLTSIVFSMYFNFSDFELVNLSFGHVIFLHFQEMLYKNDDFGLVSLIVWSCYIFYISNTCVEVSYKNNRFQELSGLDDFGLVSLIVWSCYILHLQHL